MERYRFEGTTGWPALVAIGLLTTLTLAAPATTTAQAPAAERVVAALFDFVETDPAEPPYTKDDIEDLLVRNDDSLREFIWQTSRQQVRLNIEVLDWITINKRRTDYPPTDAGGLQVVGDAIDELSYFVDLGSYDKVLLFVRPGEPGNPGCVASLGPEPDTWDTPNGTFTFGWAALGGRPDGYVGGRPVGKGCAWNGRIAHEYGHTLGFLHSMAVSAGISLDTDMSRCDARKENPVPASLLDPTYRESVYPDTCTDTWVTHGADWDMLGGDDGYELYTKHFPVHFHAMWQARAGWLRDDQVIEATGSGTYTVTTLEQLDGGVKAIRVPLGSDDRHGPVSYWLQTREFSPWTTLAWIPYSAGPCQVDVRATGTQVFSDWGGYSAGNSYFFMVTNTDDESESIIRKGSLFRDPFRGVSMEMLGCRVSVDETSAEVDIAITRTDLELVPPIVAHFSPQEPTSVITVSNNSSAAVGVRAVSIRGRHADEFAIDEDACAYRHLEAGASCSVMVSYLPGRTGDRQGVLMIDNDDAVAPNLAVALRAIR
ncbi:MAG: hypothetical protein OXH75_06825 [Acidobacteria bacterium]|nr:hypothetical protein [Acidobacteriota bacterium]